MKREDWIKLSWDFAGKLLIAIAGGFIAFGTWSSQQDTSQAEALYQRKFDLLERVSRSFHEYAYGNSARAQLAFESMNLRRQYVPSGVDSIVHVEMPVGASIDLQDSLKVLYPIAYDVMMKTDEKAAVALQDLLMIQLLFGPEVDQRREVMRRYMPIGNAIREHLARRSKNTRLEMQETNQILQKLEVEQNDDFSALLTAMAKELNAL